MVHLEQVIFFVLFMGGLADTLLSMGEMDTGITCVETFDFDVIDKIYKPFDNLVLAVTLKADGSTDKKSPGFSHGSLQSQLCFS